MTSAHDPHESDRPADPQGSGPTPPPYAPPTGAPGHGQPSYGQSGYGQTPAGHNPYGQTASGQTPSGQDPSGSSGYGQTPSGQNPYSPTPYSQPESPYGGSPYSSPAYGAATPGAYVGHPYGASAGGNADQGWGATGATTAFAPAPAKRGPSTTRTVLIAGVVALLVGGGAAAGVSAAMDDGSTTSAGLSQSTQAAPAAKVDGSVAGAASAISPSVVTINVSAGSDSGGTGSGIVIKTDGDTGYILTNNHVVTLDSQTEASANQISVTLGTGVTADAEVVGTDPPDDLAVVKIQASGLKAATFASSAKLQVGQTVVAMGAPLGLSNTVTSGIVSALARPVATGSTADAAIFNAVQTDAAINPGNSGGPLVDLNGHVVGVNSAIAGTGSGSSDTQSGNIGIGFAIPSDEASRIADELITTGKATHAVLGITVSGAQQQTGPTSGAGAPVGTVTAGSPAEKAGIKSGDVITKIGSQRIDDSIGAIAATRSFAPGTQVPVEVTSNGQTKTVQVTLGSATDD